MELKNLYLRWLESPPTPQMKWILSQNLSQPILKNPTRVGKGMLGGGVYWNFLRLSFIMTLNAHKITINPMKFHQSLFLSFLGGEPHRSGWQRRVRAKVKDMVEMRKYIGERRLAMKIGSLGVGNSPINGGFNRKSSNYMGYFTQFFFNLEWQLEHSIQPIAPQLCQLSTPKTAHPEYGSSKESDQGWAFWEAARLGGMCSVPKYDVETAWRTVPFWKGSIMIYPRFAQIRTCLGWKNENHQTGSSRWILPQYHCRSLVVHHLVI